MNNKQRINVTQSQMPNREKLHVFVDQILDSGWLTNRGQCVRELEEKLQGYLGVRNVVLANDATSGLQVAYKALDFKGEVITLPFTLYPLPFTLYIYCNGKLYCLQRRLMLIWNKDHEVQYSFK